MTLDLAALILWTTSLPLAAPAPVTAGLTFERYKIETGTAARQTVLPGFFLGDAFADLAVIHIEDDGDRGLRIYELSDADQAPRLYVTLPPEVLFVDVANIAGRDRLLTYGAGRVSWFDPESASQRPLVEVATSYNATPRGLHYAGLDTTGPSDPGEIPHIDITRDLNHDGRDDLIIPNVDGFSVFIQMEDGSFADGVKLGPPEPFRAERGFEESRTYGDVGISPLTAPWYLSRVHQVDYDHDGRSDLVFWNEDHFDVHLQNEQGLFSPVAKSFTTDVPFDSDGTYSVVFGFEDANAFSLLLGLRKKSTRTVLHSLRDMNGDGVADLVTQSLEGRSLLKQRSLYAVHFGTRTPDGTVFRPEASAAIRTQGRAPAGYSSHWLADFDGDDQVDILYGRVGTGLAGMIRAILGTSITMSCELYRLEDGSFPERPSGKRAMKSDIDFDDERDAGFWPASLVGDVNGDGRQDVLVGKNRGELHVYLGGADMLARHPQRVSVAVPGDERNSWLVDLDRDGKQDVLMHHPSTTEPHRVTMLIARQSEATGD